MCVSTHVCVHSMYTHMCIFISIFLVPWQQQWCRWKEAQWRSVATGGQTGPLGMGHLCGDHLHRPSRSEIGGGSNTTCVQLEALPQQGDTQLLSTVQRSPCDPVTRAAASLWWWSLSKKRGRRHSHVVHRQGVSITPYSSTSYFYTAATSPRYCWKATISNTLSTNRMLRVKLHALIFQLVLAGQPGLRQVLPQENSGGTGELHSRFCMRRSCFLEAQNWA